MNYWNRYRVIPGIVLLVTVSLIAGCSSPTSVDTSKYNPSESSPPGVQPSGDWSDSTEGQTYAEALNSASAAGQLQSPEESQDPTGDEPADPASRLPEQPEPDAEPVPQLQGPPAKKAAPASESQPQTKAPPQAARELSSGAAAADAPAGEANIGFQAPDFSLATLDGQSVSLADLRGRNVLLNYWVTWCIPCIEEMPILEKLNQEYQDQNLVILSVNGIQQDQLETVKTTLGEFAVTFPVTLDESNVVYDTYRVQFMPTSFFIDDQGIIRYIQLGSATEEGLRTKIEQLISDQL